MPNLQRNLSRIQCPLRNERVIRKYTTMKIVAVEPLGMTAEQVERFEHEFSLKGHTFICYPDRNEEPDNLLERMKEAEIVIVSNIKLDEEILKKCPNLKMLSVAFAGLDHIDLEYCKTHNISVINAAGYATQAVAELAIGLMLNVYRKINELDAATRKGSTRNNFLGNELGGKTVGIVGTGNIGTRTAELLQAFGCKVIAYSRTEKEAIKKMGIPYVSLEEIMQKSDIVSLHLPLTKETRGLISERLLSMCKPTAILINTARGSIVDNAALTKKLQQRALAGAGIDVFEKEPPLEPGHPLLHAPNCIVVPHVGYATREAFDTRIDIVMNNVFNYIQ